RADLVLACEAHTQTEHRSPSSRVTPCSHSMCSASTVSSTYLLYVTQTKSTLTPWLASVIGATGEDSCRPQQPGHSLCAPTSPPTQAAPGTSVPSAQTCARYYGTAHGRRGDPVCLRTRCQCRPAQPFSPARRHLY